jgi:Arc/MetJ-type ribon-helix-helix transcriptional regulator
MAAHHQLGTTPLTFELPRSLVDRIHRCRGQLGLKSVSDVVRHALEGFDFATFQAPPREQLQVSVRLAPGQKRDLFRHARRTKVSAGELLRAALEALSARVADDGAATVRRSGREERRARPKAPTRPRGNRRR